MYWIIEAHAKISPQRRKQEADAQSLEMLRAAKNKAGAKSGMSLEDLKKRLGVKSLSQVGKGKAK